MRRPRERNFRGGFIEQWRVYFRYSNFPQRTRNRNVYGDNRKCGSRGMTIWAGAYHAKPNTSHLLFCPLPPPGRIIFLGLLDNEGEGATSNSSAFLDLLRIHDLSSRFTTPPHKSCRPHPASPRSSTPATRSSPSSRSVNKSAGRRSSRNARWPPRRQWW
jgi:hypothetical protein